MAGKKPSLSLASAAADMPDMPEPSDSGDMTSQDPGVQAASLVREALESKDDQALYDALCSIVDMEMSKDGGGGADMGGGSEKPKLVIHLGHMGK
jgi:hypothetical protein